MPASPANHNLCFADHPAIIVSMHIPKRGRGGRRLRTSKEVQV